MSTNKDQYDKVNDSTGGTGRTRSSSGSNIVEKSPVFSCAKMDTNPPVQLASGLMQTYMKAPPPSEQISKGVSSCFRWVVKRGKAIPTYPLERTTRVNFPVNIVASRVDDMIKKRSVQAEFDNEEPRAICTTDSFLKYHVNLFDAGSDATIIEVQRRTGCSLEFRKERTAVICAARGESVPSEPCRLSIPADLLVNSSYLPPTDDDIMKMIENIVTQLHTKHRDGQIMCLRHLAGMTDATTSGTDTSSKAANIIMNSEIGIREIMTDHLFSGAQDDTAIMMRNSGLTVLMNSLGLFKAEEIEELSKKENIWFTESLLPSLIDNVKSCKCLHNAYLSARCLLILLKNSSILLATARQENDLEDVINGAISKGEKNHEKLFQEAKHLSAFLNV